MVWRTGIYVAFILLFLPACASGLESPESFDSKLFENDQFEITLGFDLRDDENPMAGLVINTNNVTQTEYHTIALPFETLAVESNQTIYSTSGSFYDSTLVNYYTLPSSNQTYSIGMIPIFKPGPENYYYPDDISSSVTLVHIGLERIFVYRYPDQDPRREKWAQQEGAFSNTQIDSIGVVYPRDAIGQEIRDTGLTALPTFIYKKPGVARFYPASSPITGEKALEVKYKLPPTQAQELFLEYGVKFFIALLAPIATLIVKHSDDQKGKKQRSFIYFLVGIQIIVFISLIVLAFVSWGESSINTILDLIIALISGFLAGYVLWQEKSKT